MIEQVQIGNRLVGSNQPCFIVAEAGVNHNGDISMAHQLVDAAIEAGVDAVKFQTFKTERVVTRNAEKAAYQKKTTGIKSSQYEMLKMLELSEKEQQELKDYSDKKGIIFFSTPYDTDSVDFLVRIGVPALKVSSADITNQPLLAHIAAQKIPVILSTGMSTLGEIEEGIETVVSGGNEQLVLLHCNFNYPARIEDINLRAMDTLKQAFGFPTGYSDHTMGYEVSLAAVALGAVVIEKHFTLDRNLPGPDHKASLNPGELKEMVGKIRNIQKALGSPNKKPSGMEIPNRKISRRSLAAITDIPKGTVITADMLDTKRPGTGISPSNIKDIIGRKAVTTIKEDELLTWEKVR